MSRHTKISSECEIPEAPGELSREPDWRPKLFSLLAVSRKRPRQTDKCQVFGDDCAFEGSGLATPRIKDSLHFDPPPQIFGSDSCSREPITITAAFRAPFLDQQSVT